MGGCLAHDLAEAVRRNAEHDNVGPSQRLAGLGGAVQRAREQAPADVLRVRTILGDLPRNLRITRPQHLRALAAASAATVVPYEPPPSTVTVTGLIS
jgi:hypothetical protein